MFSDIRLSEIHSDPEFNCRGDFSSIDVVDLMKDIQARTTETDSGLLQPIIVIPYDDVKRKETGKKYLLAAGYRRFMAFAALKRTTIPARIKESMTEIDARILNLSENLQRKELNILQEARAVSALQSKGMSRQDIAFRLGKSEGWVQVREMLLKLPKEIQSEAAMNIISQKQIRELYTHHKDGGTDAVLREAKKIKKARERGVTISVKKEKKSLKRMRTQAEMRAMSYRLYEMLGASLMTRVLMWGVGEVSDTEVETDIQAECDKLGVTYVMPIEE